MSYAKVSRWNTKHQYITEEGIRLEIRSYPSYYTLWAINGTVGVRLERGGMPKKGELDRDALFDRGIQSLEKFNPFTLKGQVIDTTSRLPEELRPTLNYGGVCKVYKCTGKASRGTGYCLDHTKSPNLVPQTKVAPDTYREALAKITGEV